MVHSGRLSEKRTSSGPTDDPVFIDTMGIQKSCIGCLGPVVSCGITIPNVSPDPYAPTWIGKSRLSE